MEDYPNPSKDTVLVTGATGFLGEYLVRRLTGKYRVLALGRNRDKGRYLEKLGAVFCPGDFTDESQCAREISLTNPNVPVIFKTPVS